MASWVLVMFCLPPACVNCVGALKGDRGPQYVNFKKYPSPVSLFFVIICIMNMLKKRFHVICRIPYVMLGLFILGPLGPMLHVDFKAHVLLPAPNVTYSNVS